MNNISSDIFAETNPAFCSLVIFSFCLGFKQETGNGVPFPLSLLPLPLVLSTDIAHTFKNTNVNTGFFRWTEKNPQIRLNLISGIENSHFYFKPAIQFGLFKQILEIDSRGWINPLKENATLPKNTTLKTFNTNAIRLGQWVGQVNSVATVYNHLGIQV